MEVADVLVLLVIAYFCPQMIGQTAAKIVHEYRKKISELKQES